MVAIQDGVDTRSSQLVNYFVESIQVGGVIVALRRLNSRPSYIEPDNSESILHQHGYVITVERVLSIKGAVARVEGETLVYL